MLRQNRAMADARGDKDDIPFLQFIALSADQIFYANSTSTVQQLIESMAMQLDGGIGAGGILVGIHKTGFHLQFLIKIAGINAKRMDVVMKFIWLKRRGQLWNILHRFPNFGYFHKNTTFKLFNLVILYHNFAVFAIYNAENAIYFAFIFC